MGKEDKVHDRATSPQKSVELCQDELQRLRLNRQRRQARICAKKQNLGHVPRVAPSEQDLDTGSASQPGQAVQKSTVVAGAQQACKKGQTPPFESPSQTSSGSQTGSPPILKFASHFPKCYLNPHVQAAFRFATGPGEILKRAHDQESAHERQAREERRIAMIVHNVAAPDPYPTTIHNVRVHRRPTSMNSQCGTVLANEHDYMVKEEASHDDSEWDRCLTPPIARDDGSNSRRTSLNSQCGTVLANEHDYLVREEGSHGEGEWDRCEMSSSEED
ncbi:hypothetical protein BDR22DRAFT_917901 [Usnea florida]